jgi:chemotaxis protein MotB
MASKAPRDFAAELAAAQNEIQSTNLRLSTVKGLLADREREVAALRSSAGDSAQLAAMGNATSDNDKLAQRVAELEGQLADRDKELAALHGDLSTEMAKLKEAQRGLVRALRPEIEQGNITVDINNERLLINLTSSMLFGAGEDQLKPAGTDALKRVGAILKGYPEYKVEVDGHTDNQPIRSSLKKRFPTNKELSEARAANGVTALAEGGVSAGTIVSAGYADTKPVAPNATDEGRQKNRRVEVRVTPKS